MCRFRGLHFVLWVLAYQSLHLFLHESYRVWKTLFLFIINKATSKSNMDIEFNSTKSFLAASVIWRRWLRTFFSHFYFLCQCFLPKWSLHNLLSSKLSLKTFLSAFPCCTRIVKIKKYLLSWRKKRLKWVMLNSFVDVPNKGDLVQRMETVARKTIFFFVFNMMICNKEKVRFPNVWRSLNTIVKLQKSITLQGVVKIYESCTMVVTIS